PGPRPQGPIPRRRLDAPGAEGILLTRTRALTLEVEQPADDRDEADEHQREGDEQNHGDGQEIAPGSPDRPEVDLQRGRPAGALDGDRARMPVRLRERLVLVPVRLQELDVPGVRLEG